MPRPVNQLQELARLGAEVRLRELKQEVAALLARFPALRRTRGANPSVAPLPSPRRAANAVPTRGRRRRKLSAAGRERIRQAQLKRWAAVKAGKKR
jgi:hypothetical protein